MVEIRGEFHPDRNPTWRASFAIPDSFADGPTCIPPERTCSRESARGDDLIHADRDSHLPIVNVTVRSGGGGSLQKSRAKGRSRGCSTPRSRGSRAHDRSIGIAVVMACDLLWYFLNLRCRRSSVGKSETVNNEGSQTLKLSRTLSTGQRPIAWRQTPQEAVQPVGNGLRREARHIEWASWQKHNHIATFPTVYRAHRIAFYRSLLRKQRQNIIDP